MKTYELSVFISSEKEQTIEELVMKIMEALHDGEMSIVITPEIAPVPKKKQSKVIPTTRQLLKEYMNSKDISGKLMNPDNK